MQHRAAERTAADVDDGGAGARKKSGSQGFREPQTRKGWNERDVLRPFIYQECNLVRRSDGRAP